MSELITLIDSVGFPIVVTLILLYDKIKTNGSLRRVVENNNSILTKLEKKIC